MISWLLPIKTVSENNSTEHWRKKHARHKIQKNYIRMQFLIERPQIMLPCTITLTRIAPRALDSDNLQGSLKWIRDSIADNIIEGLSPGRADSDPRLTWIYAQKKGNIKEYALLIEICYNI